MNTTQKRLLVAGLLFIALFVFIQPIRYQNPFYLPIIDSIHSYTDTTTPYYLDNPIWIKNIIAAGLVLAGTSIGLYYFRDDKHILT